MPVPDKRDLQMFSRYTGNEELDLRKYFLIHAMDQIDRFNLYSVPVQIQGGN
jgi:hypothetical protein